ncbi:MAG: hypothetical protein OEY61_07140, partial [Gammaproteobacteria bacterium]|nr:hypothetical protein [Gammaproteobacteria bacterium]
MKFYKSNPVQAGLILLFLFFAMSFYLISIYVAQERKRDLNGWQSKLNIMADVNQEKLESFLNAEKNKLQELSANSSLKLFLTENYLNNVKNDDVYHAQYAHIRNLIHSVAKDYGFVGANQDSVNTESDPRINKGLALVDSEGRILMATKGFIKDDNYFRDVMVATLESGENKFIDLFKL